MSTTEIILNMLAETATKDISARTKPETFAESKKVANIFIRQFTSTDYCKAMFYF